MIQEGDACAAVCGAKEPRGRVRVLGLGPTPQEIGTPGLKALMSTRMQMEIFARQKAESKNRTLEQRILELEEERIAQRTNVEVLSQHGSNSRQYASPTPERPIDEAHNAPRLEEYDNYVDDEDYDQDGDEDENLLPHTNVEMEETLPPSRPTVAQSARPTVAQSAMNMNIAPTSDIHPYIANDTHVATEESLLPPRPVAVRSAVNLTTAPANDFLPRSANDRHGATHSLINKTTTTTNVGPRLHDDLVGRDVILYAILRSELPVARGTVISTNPNTIVGGQPLGNEYCEVVVDLVMKRDAMLPRTYGEMQTMASAVHMNIAWPFNKVKECKKRGCGKAFNAPHKGSTGSARHKSLA